MLVAYIRGRRSVAFGGAESPEAAFWAEKLGASTEQIAAIIGDYAKFSNLVRGKLMKRGGVGYVQPSPESFPTVDEFHAMIVACGALPCATWLDGTTAGEQAIDELLDAADRPGRGRAQHHPRPQLEHRRSRDARSSRSPSCTRSWRIAAAARSAAERRHRDERAGQQAGGRFRRAGDGAGASRRSWTARTSSTATRSCSGRWGWAIRATGRRRICRRGGSATRSTRRWAIGCRRARPGWRVLRGIDATTPAAILNAI